MVRKFSAGASIQLSLVLTFVAIHTLGCSVGRAVQPDPPAVNRLDLEVYQPVLAHMAEKMRKHRPSALLLVADTTHRGSCESAGAVGYRRRDVTIMTLEVSMNLRNRDRFYLPLAVATLLRAVGSRDIPTWRQFGMKHRRFGDSEVYGVARLSAPGYGWDENLAILEVGVECGYLCGHGQLFILQKEIGGWHIREVIDTWVS
jgi:hypothetical protein